MYSVEVFYNWVSFCFSWLPIEFVGIIGAMIFVKFGDALLGVITRAWKVLGRG